LKLLAVLHAQLVVVGNDVPIAAAVHAPEACAAEQRYPSRQFGLTVSQTPIIETRRLARL